jgi:hypothetical protein
MDPARETLAMTVALVRPDDLLNLTVEWQNLRIDKSDLKNPILVVDNPATSGLLTFVFPPQTIAESAFFESSTIPPEGKNRPPDPVGGNDPVTAPGDVAKGAHTTAQLAHSSRLVFSVPDSARIPFTLEGLLDWSKLKLQVNPIAAIPAHPSNSQISSAPGIREPLPTETAIELPYRLVISPNEAVTWQHRGSVFAAGGWAELWHTRLALKAPDGTITDLSRTDTAPLRAIWSPDYNPAKPPKPGEPDDDLGLTAMSKNDRHQIVILTSAFHGYEVEKNVSFEGPFGAVRYHFKGPFVPDPVQAEQLMLSPLGGWLKSRGHWNPPYEVRTVRIGAVGQMFNVGDFLGARDIARQPAAQPARPGIDLRLKLPGTRTEKGEPLDLSEWVHVSTQGRDHYVRIVYEGELWPFRHRAALIKITERQFREPPTGGIGAYLIQHMFIVVREPVKTFADDDRAMPLKRVELTTRVTPDIAFPQNITSTQRSFWVEVTTGGAREKFKFHAVAQDAAGRFYLVPGINPSSTPQWRPHRKAACGKTARAVCPGSNLSTASLTRPATGPCSRVSADTPRFGVAMPPALSALKLTPSSVEDVRRTRALRQTFCRARQRGPRQESERRHDGAPDDGATIRTISPHADTKSEEAAGPADGLGKAIRLSSGPDGAQRVPAAAAGDGAGLRSRPPARLRRANADFARNNFGQQCCGRLAMVNRAEGRRAFDGLPTLRHRQQQTILPRRAACAGRSIRPDHSGRIAQP